ncbi:MAG: AAA family ATPase [Deltaproteobacteria bacterium]|nr:AAA family ATPase [Deltaproteobacteria bacterium]
MELSTLILRLQDPTIYPDHPSRVDVVQTHISALFLIERYVYKIKKPVDFGFLDFTTLEKRLFFCQEEVRLNRRLCPDIYLGVREIRWDGRSLSLEPGPGEVVEYAVQMRRLPQERMMDRLLARGEVSPALLRRIAEKLADFHARAAAGPRISSFAEMGTIRGNWEENFAQTEKYISLSIAAGTFLRIREGVETFLRENPALFQERISGGRIRDGHGDLHLQHICLSDDILIFDCIEFNDRFRCCDVAADLAFLLMDLDFHACPDLSAELAAAYMGISRDWSLFLLLDFYKCYRAYVRGKVIGFRWDDPVISQTERTAALEEAREYFHLAERYASRLNRPFLLLTCGLMGTGKSTIARALAAALGWEHLSSDVERKRLAQIPPAERRREKFQQGIYSPDFSRATYEALLDGARRRLTAGKSVLLDASFSQQRFREEALALARRLNAEFLLLECRAPEELIRRRLATRGERENEPSDGRWELFPAQKSAFEEVSLEPDLHLPLNTGKAVEECLQEIIRHLLNRAGKNLPGLAPAGKEVGF